MGQSSGHAMFSLESAPLSQRICRAVVNYTVYVGKTVWPANLAVFYPDVPVQTYARCPASAFLALVTGATAWAAHAGNDG